MKLRPSVRTHNTRIKKITILSTPAQLKADFPITELAWKTVSEGRETIANIIHGRDPRLLVVMGPCSVHSIPEMFTYAKWFKKLQLKLQAEGDRIYLAMRVVFVKPRTKRAWRGFSSDPDMDGKCNIEKGWRLGRQLALAITEMGIPIATEYLEVNYMQRMDDLYSLHWMGARNDQSQGCRDEATALSTPVGFKNATDGTLETALSSMQWAAQPNVLVAPSDSGMAARFETEGNPDGFLILRGGSRGSNYSVTDIADASEMLSHMKLNPRVLVDVSHGNSEKNHRNQGKIISELGRRLAAGEKNIGGLLYESYGFDGNQPLIVTPGKRPNLKPGLSVTDECDGMERSEKIMLDLNRQIDSESFRKARVP